MGRSGGCGAPAEGEDSPNCSLPRRHCRTDFGGGRSVKSAEERAQLSVRTAKEGSPEELFEKVVEDKGILWSLGGRRRSIEHFCHL